MIPSPSQRAAVHALGPNLQIIVCPGSGKAQVISARTIGLHNLPGVTPANIVASTLTEKAAGELKERIYCLFGSRALFATRACRTADLLHARSRVDIMGNLPNQAKPSL